MNRKCLPKEMFARYLIDESLEHWNEGEKMDLKTVKNMLSWNSPIGVGMFFVCSGPTVYFLTLSLQNIVNL
jgi:hypothetical protein